MIPTRWHKVRVVAKPIQDPTPKADNATTQMPMTLPITMMNLAKGKFQENPPQGGSPADNNPPPLENIPARAGSPWPETRSTLENLFESRKDWPIPPIPTSTPTIKVQVQPCETEIPGAAVAPKQIK